MPSNRRRYEEYIERMRAILVDVHYRQQAVRQERVCERKAQYNPEAFELGSPIFATIKGANSLV